MAKKTTYYDYLRQELGGLIEQLQLPELYKQSLKRRWLDQVVWADKKAAECRRWHYRLRLTTIVGSVILPALVGINFQLGKDNPLFRAWFPYVPFALSQVIAISAAIEEFCRYGDRWRDYRQMAEDLKAEGWQYLQLSGAYQQSDHLLNGQLQEAMQTIAARKLDSPAARTSKTNHTPTTHLKSYSLFASRVENIIKQDVQNYISDLIKQQAKQEQEIEQYLEAAQATTQDKTLFAQSATNGDVTRVAAPIAATPTMPPPGYPPSGYGQTMMAVSPNPPLAGNGQPGGLMPPPIVSPPPVPPPLVASPPVISPASPPSPPPAPTFFPSTDLNAAIVAAANHLRGMSTAEGPDGGNNACAWTLNKVLHQAGIAPLGENPNYVPSLLDALKQGRGKLVSPTESRAGDLVIACGEAHIGIGLTDGCSRVLSNSSSRACFVWESDTDFDGSYGGSSTIYRLLH
ncbi:DUF4231 domain-containing protein [Pantanalinema sp. GBBB05]|uniref:DUF4231 domain-containing protein n=1 Tax=Pantanalinema sp. GBBB05 TaxID=2604139 RepID=UPI001DEB440F|nr:DUF4231 domain-containing protein [Pantanalinema sp. GBBB05]